MKRKSILTSLAYVNDFIPTICHKSLASQFKSYLNSHFKVEDLGAPKILPLAGSCTKDQGISICQRKYASEFLEDTDLVPSQLMEQNLKQTHSDRDPLTDPTSYRRLLGKLL